MAESEQLRRMRAGFRAWNEGEHEKSLSFARADVIWRVEPFFPDMEVRFRARARDGLEFERPFHQIYRYDDENQLREFHGFVDEAEARREAGLRDG